VKQKTFIYLIPKKRKKQYNQCTELIIVKRFLKMDYNIIPIYNFYIIKILFYFFTKKIDGIIVNSINVLWKNKLITKLNDFIPIYWWYFDTTQINRKNFLKVSKLAPKVKKFFNKEKAYFNNYRKMGINPIWLDQGTNPECNFINTSKIKFDLGFIGSMNWVHKERTDLLKELNEKYKLAIYTPHEVRFKKNGFKYVFPAIPHSDFGKIVSEIKIMLNLNITKSQPYYWSNRIHLLLGSGAFCISEYIEGIEKSYENKRDCLFFNTKKELYELIDYWIQNKNNLEREKIRHDGFITTHKKHSYEKRIIEFLNHIEKNN